MLGTAIDLILGLLFVFLVFGLVTSGIYEGIARWFSWRSKDLWDAVRKLLEKQGTPTETKVGEPRLGVSVRPARGDDPRPTGGASVTPVEKLYAHPLVGDIETLATGVRTKVDHIPPDSFAGAMIDILVPGNDKSVDAIKQRLQTVTDELPDFPLRKPLLELANEVAGEAGEQLDAYRKKVSVLFDTQMTRLSKLYRRRAKLIMIIIGMGVAIALNVNAIHVADELYHNDSLRTATADAAQDVADACKDERDAAQTACLKREIKKVDASELELPVGWGGDIKWGLGNTLIRLAGWLLAGIALAQGGPFWFDLIKKISGYRKT